jgi:hypothetical protein
VHVTAWSNGSPRSTGAGYGLRVSLADRDRYFDSTWTHVEIDLGTQGIALIPLSDSFWSRCVELRSAAVGRWLIGRRLAPWSKGAPPLLDLHPTGGNRFQMSEQGE